MLANLLPGLRDLRTPLATGYLWLLCLWLVVGDSFPPRSAANGVPEKLYELIDYFGPPAAIAAITFAAYLTGSLLQVSKPPSMLSYLWRTPLARRYEDHDEQLTEFAAAQGLRILNDGRLDAHSLDRVVSSPAVHDLRMKDAEARRSGTSPEAAADAAKEVFAGNLIDLLYEVLSMEVPRLSTRLHAQNPELFGDYDRRRAEAELRLSLVAPGVVLTIVLALQWSVLALLGLVPCLALAVKGWMKEQEAEGVIAQALLLNVISSPTVDRLDAWFEQAPGAGTPESGVAMGVVEKPAVTGSGGSVRLEGDGPARSGGSDAAVPRERTSPTWWDTD